MSASIGAYLLALYSAILSLCVAIEQVFIEPIATYNYLWAETTLWAITFILIGIGLILESAGEDCKQ